jgi:hypothetical protein
VLPPLPAILPAVPPLSLVSPAAPSPVDPAAGRVLAYSSSVGANKEQATKHGAIKDKQAARL